MKTITKIDIAISAIENDDVETIKVLIEVDDAELNVLFKSHKAIIHAAGNGSFEVLKFLLSNNKKLVDIEDEKKQTPLLWAAAAGFDDIVEYLADMGANINAKTVKENSKHNNLSAIHWAIKNNHEKVVTCLINRYVLLNVRFGIDKLHIIHFAAKYGNYNIVSMLLKALPGNINILDARHRTPISFAIIGNHLELVQELVQMGADLTIPCTKYSFLPAHLAISYGRMAIFQYLQPLLPKVYECISKDNQHYIHVATNYRRTEIVEHLLDKNQSLIDKLDANNLPPIFNTIGRGLPTLKVLLARGAKPYARIKNFKNTYKDVTFEEYVTELQDYKIINCLLLFKYAQNDKESILEYIHNASQLIALMIEEPEFRPLIFKDARLIQLLSTKFHCKLKEDSMSWYQRSKKRNSFFIEVNKRTNKLACFEPKGFVGKGGYGDVRLFQSEDGETLVVKAPNEKDIGVEKRKKELANDLYFNTLAYPSDKYEAFEFDGKYSYRFIMPYIPYYTVDVSLSQITSSYQLARAILLIAQELLRIHTLGILHKDLHERNIMLSLESNEVRLIDFGLSCSLNDASMDYIKTVVTKWWAPEICNDKGNILKPHVNQDIYSFGYLLNQYLPQNPCYQHLIDSFSMIKEFIDAALDLKPEHRPTLETFCTSLNNEIERLSEVIDINPGEYKASI